MCKAALATRLPCSLCRNVLATLNSSIDLRALATQQKQRAGPMAAVAVAAPLWQRAAAQRPGGSSACPPAYSAAARRSQAAPSRIRRPKATASSARRGAWAASAAGRADAGGGGGGETKEEFRSDVLTCQALFKNPDYLFAMPPIQRPYDWDESDAELLLNDLLAALGAERRNIRWVRTRVGGASVPPRPPPLRATRRFPASGPAPPRWGAGHGCRLTPPGRAPAPQLLGPVPAGHVQPG